MLRLSRDRPQPANLTKSADDRQNFDAVWDEQGRWGPCDKTRLRQIKIGDYSWIGEGAIIMANIGAGTIVAAGAVVEQDARAGILLAGNPSRFVRQLRDELQTQSQGRTGGSGAD